MIKMRPSYVSRTGCAGCARAPVLRKVLAAAVFFAGFAGFSDFAFFAFFAFFDFSELLLLFFGWLSAAASRQGCGMGI